MISALLRTLRPVQWTKNVFVLAPLLFAGALTEPEALRSAFIAFAGFCCASSAVYIFNDIRDRDEDRRHPLKRNRPLASGDLSIGVAWFAFVVLAAVSLVSAASLGTNSLVLLAVYLGANLGYSLGLKRVVILDVMIVSAGFLLRVLAGGAAIQVEVSAWLLLCTTFLALFLTFSKRRHELILLADQAAEQRQVLSHYSDAFLDQMINVVTASTVVCYALYAISAETVDKFHTRNLIWTMPMVLFGIFRYLYLMYQKPSERNPTEAILRDVPFLANLGLWLAVAAWVVYRG